ncbi:MAG: hypothetical protein E5Y82_13750 [Mesorhizobium sp.]|nr:MAG: hypothetical protein E5Y82_13750 [Mesorhizobium sp.]
MAWPPEDGKPYMPANGTEGEIFYESWCAHCARDAAFREDVDRNEGCQILADSYCGVQSKDWVWRKGAPACLAFTDDPACPVRCPHTLELFQ